MFCSTNQSKAEASTSVFLHHIDIINSLSEHGKINIHVVLYTYSSWNSKRRKQYLKWAPDSDAELLLQMKLLLSNFNIGSLRCRRAPGTGCPRLRRVGVNCG